MMTSVIIRTASNNGARRPPQRTRPANRTGQAALWVLSVLWASPRPSRWDELARPGRAERAGVETNRRYPGSERRDLREPLKLSKKSLFKNYF